MIVNVCPAAVTRAAPERVWQILVAPERLGEWTDAKYLSADPPGPAATGQLIKLGSRGLGRVWLLTIEIGDMDPGHRWIDMLVRLPLGLSNYEHLTLTPAPEGGTLIRFN